MVAAETVYAVFFCNFSLPLQSFLIQKVIIIIVKRNSWLVMPLKKWFGSFHVMSPPFIIFWRFMELWQIECNYFHFFFLYFLIFVSSFLIFKFLLRPVLTITRLTLSIMASFLEYGIYLSINSVYESFP